MLSLKRHLTEAVSESVYVTKDSLTALVQSYHSNLQDVTRPLRYSWSSESQGKVMTFSPPPDGTFLSLIVISVG